MLKRISLVIVFLGLLNLLFLIFFDRNPEILRSFINVTDKFTPSLYKQTDDSYFQPSYPLPKEALESDAPLPEKVKKSFESVIGITAQFNINNQVPTIFPPEVENSGGTGFFEESGNFISARHIFLTSIIRLRSRGFPFIINKQGLPQAEVFRDGRLYYNYSFYGSVERDGKPLTFPLVLTKMGKLGQFQDLAVFKTVDTSLQIEPLAFEETVSLGEILYNAGYVPLFQSVEGENSLLPLPQEVLFDTLHYSFSGQLSAVISNLPINKLGIKKLYRIRMGSEYGFSGGPVFNKEGKVVGVTLLRVNNFSYAVSAEDVKAFLKTVKN